MKTTFLYLFLSFSIIAFIFSSCSVSNDDKAKQAVREYLQEKGITEYTEEHWGKLDSVFTPFYLNMSYEITNVMIERDISQHEYIISELKFNPIKNKSRINILRDSISLLKDSLFSVKSIYYDRLKEGEKNRLGISLKLKYKTILGDEKTSSFTFVFNSNDSDFSVGHHLDIFGNVCK